MLWYAFFLKSAIYYIKHIDSLWSLFHNYIYEDIYYIKSKKEKEKRIKLNEDQKRKQEKLDHNMTK